VEQFRVHEWRLSIRQGSMGAANQAGRAAQEPFSYCCWLKDAVEDALQHVSVQPAAG
jgi:hypothetical protein